LTVANLERQISFYTQVLGFKLHWQEESEAALGTEAEVLLRLTEEPSARRVQNSAGMYHFAILYPSRKELARAIARLFALRYPNSPTDHGVSMTTYLDDLEGNNIEL
jgi:catechol 2,3-dioxygenase